MHPPATAPAPKRALWPWLLLAGILAPFVLLGVAAASYLTLDRDAAVLRRQVMRASSAEWSTKVQLSLGNGSFSLLRGFLAFVQNKEVDEAKFALRAVRSVSVGVYHRRGGEADWLRANLMSDTDQAMRSRGWTRVVGVVKGNDTVMIYVPEDAEELDEVCLAVVNGGNLVVVSARIHPDELIALVERHAHQNNFKLGEKLRWRNF